jgi:hypothetical protein
LGPIPNPHYQVNFLNHFFNNSKEFIRIILKKIK